MLIITVSQDYVLVADLSTVRYLSLSGDDDVLVFDGNRYHRTITALQVHTPTHTLYFTDTTR